MANRMNESSLGFARRSAVAMAVGLMVASGAVYAQSNATGSVYGVITATAGTTVLLENPATGFKRVLTPDATGRVSASSLPVGTYRATLLRNGKAVQTLEGIEVRISQGAELAFGSTLETVTVTGSRKALDVSSADSGATFNAKQLAALPTGRNLDGIIKLAPNTTNSDPRYPGGASIGGGAASENSYYINGFPVTNPLNQLGSSELPFGAIDQAQILNGGFGAEFGRSTGGVINVITKSGTNTWEFGAQASVSPASFRNAPRDRYYRFNGTSSDGTLFLRRNENTQSQTQFGGYVGGPLIKDKLFMFVSAEQKTTKAGYLDSVTGTRQSLSVGKDGWVDSKAVTTRYMGKFDWNITDGHRVDVTLLGDIPKADFTYSGYNYATHQRNFVNSYTEHWKNDEDGLTTSGAESQIVRYIGDITDNLTVTALFGQSVTKRESSVVGNGVDGSLPRVSFEDANTSKAPGVNYSVANSYPGQLYIDGNKDKVKSFRFDLEYKLGAHTIRAGLDDNRMSTLNGGKSAPPGGRAIQFRRVDPAQAANHEFTLNDTGAQKMWLANPTNGPLAAQGYIGVETVSSTISNAYSNQTAQYIEDRWQATKTLQLTAGLRRETYENLNSEKVAFLKVGKQLNPRFSAVWDANGDSSLKVFGSAGRYSIQIPTLVAMRGANGSINTSRVFTYTGVDANGMPTGRIDQTQAYSTNSEYGQAKDARSVAATNIRPAYQDEMIVGIEKALTQTVNGGVKFTHRALKQTIDDTCDWRPLFNWLKAHPAVSGDAWYAAVADMKKPPEEQEGLAIPWSCASFNPGYGNAFDINFNGDGKTYSHVDLTAAELGYTFKPKRTYTALDFFLEHPFKNGWYGKVTYTYSKNKGNTEGQTLSDRAQRDVSATMTWDHPELMEYADGYLPNDRRHQLKAYGYVALGSEWQVAGAATFESGRPRTCLGLYAGPSKDDPLWQAMSYGTNYHYCGDKPSPRGSLGRLPENTRIDLSVTYKPSFFKGLELTTEIFNVLNQQSVLAVEERSVNNNGKPRAAYEMPVGFGAPRSFRFTATYNRQF